MHSCAHVQAWLDPDLDPSNGIDERSQHAMLRLDALVMRVQLNIRFLLEVCCACARHSTPPLTRQTWNDELF